MGEPPALLGSVEQMEAPPLGHTCAEPGSWSLSCQLGTVWRTPSTRLKFSSSRKKQAVEGLISSCVLFKRAPNQHLERQFYPKLSFFIQTDVSFIPFVPSHIVLFFSFFFPFYLYEIPSIDHTSDTHCLEQLGLNADTSMSVAGQKVLPSCDARSRAEGRQR